MSQKKSPAQTDAQDEAEMETLAKAYRANRKAREEREAIERQTRRIESYEQLDPDIKQAITESLVQPSEKRTSEQNWTDVNKKQDAELPRIPEASDGLSPKQRIAIGHLICGQSMSATAAAMGISRTTLHKWRNDPVFVRTLQAKSCDALDATATRARNLLLLATRELECAFEGGSCFNSALRLVNSGRLWAMANIAPKAEIAYEIATSQTDAESAATQAAKQE